MAPIKGGLPSLVSPLYQLVKVARSAPSLDWRWPVETQGEEPGHKPYASPGRVYQPLIPKALCIHV